MSGLIMENGEECDAWSKLSRASEQASERAVRARRSRRDATARDRRAEAF